MYLKDKKTVTIGSTLIDIEDKSEFKILDITSTGRFLIYLIIYCIDISYYMDRDFKVRGLKDQILFKLNLIKKIKYKRKRYKNG